MNIKKDDKVIVLSGKDKGKTGKVMVADPKNDKVIVEGVNTASKHQAPKKQGEEGGIIKINTPLYASKVQLVCPKCGKAIRPAHKVMEKTVAGKNKTKSVRVCPKCGAEI
jgi:large subunit ribosomal protein L24